MKNILFLMLLCSSILCDASDADKLEDAQQCKYIQEDIDHKRLDAKTASSRLGGLCGGTKGYPLAMQKLFDTKLVDLKAKSRALLYAAHGSNVVATNILIAQGASTEEWSSGVEFVGDSRTPLGMVCGHIGVTSQESNTTLAIIKALVEVGANVNAKYHNHDDGKTPFDYIIERSNSTDRDCTAGTCNCHSAVATKLLLDKGVKVELLHTSYSSFLSLKSKSGRRCKKTDDLIEKAYTDHLDKSIGQGHADMTCSIQ